MLIRRLTLCALTAISLSAFPSTAFSSSGQKCDTDECISLINKTRKLARWGNPRAQYLVGIALLNGDGVEKNVESGMRYLRKASLAGLGHASYQLAYEYRTGSNVEKDLSAYQEYLMKAVGRGYPKAVHELAVSHIKKNKLDQAFELLEQNLEKKYHPSMYLLGKLKLNQTQSDENVEEVAALFYRLKTANFLDSASIYEQIVATKPEVKQYIATAFPDDGTERITVSGRKTSLTLALDDFLSLEKQFSIYDGSTTGSRIKGKVCGSSGQSCRAITEEDLMILEATAGSGSTVGQVSSGGPGN